MDIILNKEKYILLYIDYSPINIEIINNIVNCLNIKFIIIKQNHDYISFNNNMIVETIPDNILEYQLLNNCEFIIYLSIFKRNDIFFDFINKNYKLILYNIKSINEDLLYIKNDYNILKFEKNIDNNNKNIFINIYCNFNESIIDNKQNKNININITKKIDNKNDKISAVTVFKNNDNNILKIIQLKCIIENLNNKNIDKIIVIGSNLEELLKDIIKEYSNRIIIYNKDGNISYKDILDIINLLIKNNSIVCLLMSDIILPNQDNLNNLHLEMGLLDKEEVYSLSRLDRLSNGNIIKSDKLSNSLFSTEQDAWIFMTPLKLNDKSLNNLCNIYFYDYLSNLYFNNEIKENNYILINNTKKYKIFRFMLNNQIYHRPLITKESNYKDNNINNLYMLPSNEVIDNISIEQLIKLINLNDNEIYSIKCDLFNKYLKNKIMNNI